jgi:HEAT repeat protein
MFEHLCQPAHAKLLYGKCPWCGHTVIEGRDSHPQVSVQIRCIKAGSIDERDAKTIVPHLLVLFEHDNAVVRRDAAAFLGQLGPYAKEALPALSRLLQDDDQAVRHAAEEAIIRIEKQ